MKIKCTLILSILTILCLFNPVFAENNEDTVNICEWSFKMLTKGSDQDKNVIVSKYYKAKDHDAIAFCVEPNESFKPVGSTYIRKQNKNENILNIVKAYHQLNKEENEYYIAAQLLIWQQVNEISYTFNGCDYSSYKNEILDLINQKTLLKSQSSNEPIESYVNEVVELKEDYTDYNAQGEGIEIIENNENSFKYKIINEEPIYKTIYLSPIDNDEDHSYIYESDTSQDIYYYDGDYKELKPKTLSVKSLIKSSMSINYSKKNENGRPISGAEFSLYEINNSYDKDLLFIQINKDINLFEAILNDYSIYNNLSIEVSERYQNSIKNGVINTSEIGYFPYEIFDNDILITNGIVYVMDDTQITNNLYSKSSVKRIFKGYSEDLDVNSINNIENNKAYYLCESEPKKGYTYASNPCVIVDTNTYTGETLDFINNTRTYTLRLMKQSPEKILLDGAKFKITYIDGLETNELIFTTGYLNIDRENNYKYLIYKHANDTNPTIKEFEDDTYIENVSKQGKYYYYQSDSNIVNNDLLNDKYVEVLKGGFIIENMPYSSSITVEELQAPKGFIITEPIYHITPDIKYSDITFKNYRINYLDIIPKKRFKFPKTCIDE